MPCHLTSYAFMRARVHARLCFSCLYLCMTVYACACVCDVRVRVCLCVCVCVCVCVTSQVRRMWPNEDTSQSVSDVREGVRLWRDRLLNPWRYKRMAYSDAELERMVDKAFRCGRVCACVCVCFTPPVRLRALVWLCKFVLITRAIRGQYNSITHRA